jgi:hypothetical protein
MKYSHHQTRDIRKQVGLRTHQHPCTCYERRKEGNEEKGHPKKKGSLLQILAKKQNFL